MQYFVSIPLLLVIVYTPESLQWQNSYDGVLNVECDNDKAFYRVQSHHENWAEDRVWQWDCRQFSDSADTFDDCTWTNWLNWYDAPIYYLCPEHYVMNGVYSVHANWAEDRRWKVKCCKATNYFATSCSVTSHLNNYDTDMDYSADSPRVFTGMFSAHMNSPEDRIWSVQSCLYEKCSGGLTCESSDNACEHITNSKDGGGVTCSCYDGYTLASNGRSCIDIDECATNNGQCTHTCINIPGSYHCFCEDGFELANDTVTCNDIDECAYDSVHACQHTCNNTEGYYECTCDEGFYLADNNVSCIDVNECDWENGQCDQICNNQQGSYNCSCLPGYWLGIDGRTCYDIDECQMSDASCEHRCENTIGSFNCYCDQGYQLVNVYCTDVNECNDNNGGCDHTCVNTVGSFYCQCDTGYQLGNDGYSCPDINECSNNNGGCEHNCTNTQGSFSCSCRVGYELSSTQFCSEPGTEASRVLGVVEDETGIFIIIPVAIVILVVAVILAVVITVLIMRKKVKEAGKAMIYKGHGVRGLYPEGASQDSPPLNRYDPDTVSMNSLKRVLEDNAANYEQMHDEDD